MFQVHFLNFLQIWIHSINTQTQKVQESDICHNPYPSSTTISYQIHSWNDLREWDQALHKGATWFKIGKALFTLQVNLQLENKKR